MWYHLVGISGISMRTIAEILKRQGHKVTGSDLKLNGHSKDNIVDEIDAVVYTSAVTIGSDGWVEIEEAKRKGIKLIKRGKILAELVSNRKVIAISGTHGKTTTTSMVGLTLIEAGFDPLVIVGEEVNNFGGTYRYGDGEWAVVESCEYDRNFLYLRPQIAVITNIEEEHLDHYPGGINDLKSAFTKFALQTKKGGAVVVCGDDQSSLDVVGRVGGEMTKITYGLDKTNDVSDLNFNLSLPGDHNRRNALATIAVAELLEINIEIVEKAISKFRGAHRRFEIKGEINGVLVIDDYGHHPTEIAALLAGVREKYPKRKVVAVFWPHQYKRTKVFLNRFPNAFNLADEVIIKEIFFVPGRDKKSDISGKDIVNLINVQNRDKAVFIDDDRRIIDHLNKTLKSGDILATIGIPPVHKIAEEYLGGK